LKPPTSLLLDDSSSTQFPSISPLGSWEQPLHQDGCSLDPQQPVELLQSGGSLTAVYVRLPKVAATTQAFAAWCEGEVGIGWDRNSQLGKELGKELALKTDPRING